MRKPKKGKTDTDHPWKQVFTYFFESGILFIDPELHEAIVWDKGVEFLEQELHEIIKTRFMGAKICDKLAKVWLKNGEEACFLLVHVEIELNPKVGFPKRFYWYRTFIFDKHKTENIYSIAIYHGLPSKNQADKYEHRFLRNRVLFEFPVFKIWEQDEAALEKSDNIFALFVLAQLYANRSKNNMGKRLTFRKHLFDLAFEKKIPKQIIFQALIFVRYLTTLPDNLEIDYRVYEKEKLHKNQSSMFTIEDSKYIDSLIESATGNSLQKMLKAAQEERIQAIEEAKKAKKKAEQEAKKAEQEAKKAEQEAKRAEQEAMTMKTGIVVKSFFDLKLDVETISNLVGLSEKETRSIIAKEKKRRNGSKSNH